MLVILDNPIIQGLIVNLLTSVVHWTIKDSRKVSVAEQLESVVDIVIDRLSEQFPIASRLNGVAFWDVVAKRIASEVTHQRIGNDHIKGIVDDTFADLLKNVDRKDLIDQINAEFWELLKEEVLECKELWEYMVLANIEGLNEKMGSLVTLLQEKHGEIDPELFAEQIQNYLVAMQQSFIHEMESDFITRKFQFPKIQSTVELTDLIGASKNVLILGEPGTGKTYVLKKLLYEVITSANDGFTRIPIMLNLSAYKSSYKNITEAIWHLLKKYFPHISLEHVAGLLNDGRFLLLLDGLDEVKKVFYEDCLYDIRDLIQHNAANRYIISCRDNRYYEELNNYVEISRIRPLERGQIDKYLKNYCSQFYPYQLSNEQYSLLGNPLLLTLAVEVINKNEGRIPENKSILFRKYTSYLLYNWEMRKGLRRSNPLSQYDIVTFLGKLSFECFEEPVLTTLELQKALKYSFPNKEIHAVFEQLIGLGIFQRELDDQIFYSHKTFLEYFAAQHIVERIEAGEPLDRYIPLIGDRSWHEVFIFCAGLITNWDQQNEFLSCVLEQNIKLYVDCIAAKHDCNEMLSKLDSTTYAIKYLEILGDSYEKIIDVHFPQIRRLFMPYRILADNPVAGDGQIKVVGSFTPDKKHLRYYFTVGDLSSERVIIDNIDLGRGKPQRWRLKSYEQHFVNLELSGLEGDSARTVALDRIKGNLSKILKERSLNEDITLLVERFDEMKRHLPVKDTEDISEVCNWLDFELGGTGKFNSYMYNRVDLVKFGFIANKLRKEAEDLNQHRLPGPDINSGGGFVWDLYSKERLVERIKWFFYFHQKSFAFLVEENFGALREYLPDYSNLPYKYNVEVYFPEITEQRYNSEPVMMYYYLAVDSHDDCIPEVTIADPKIASGDILKEIKNSFKDKKRSVESLGYSHAGITRILFELRTGRNLPILANSYEMLEKNLESIFGRIL